MAFTFYGPAHPSKQAQDMGYSGSFVFDPQIGSEIAKLPGTLANAAGTAFTGYASGLGDMFRGYGAALGTLGTAGANERSNFYGSNAMMEAARQGAIGNIGSAGLGAFGAASNSAFDAWKGNQQAYNQALASMNAANQTGMSQLGQSRNAALAGMAQAGANTGSSSFGMGGGMGGPLNMSFYAGAPSGMVGRGSYGGGDGGSGMQMSGSVTRGNAGLINQAMASVNDPSYLTALQQGAERDTAMLDRQHMSSRDQPQQMLGGVLKGLRDMASEAYGNSSRGADQYYATSNRALDAGLGQQRDMLDTLGSTFGSASNQLGGGFGKAMGVIGGGMTMAGNTGMFSTPLQLSQRARAASLYQQNAAAEDRMASLAANAARAQAMLDARERMAAAGVPGFAMGHRLASAGSMAHANAMSGILQSLLQRARAGR